MNFRSDLILDDNFTFQMREIGKGVRDSNVKMILYVYRSDDSSDILSNVK